MSKETEPSEGKTTLPTRELVLCFDGTGNTFRADGGESNILKIFRMLDRTKENRFAAAGIGTDVTMASFSSLAYQAVANLPTSRIVDQALATSFNDHVISGYRFLARRWVPGSRIYLFGFSRGAYTARFLNEMLDFAGLISADNEETIPFVWDAFIRWKFAESEQEIKETEASLRMCRETMCRSPGLVHFLGLFDTVNSVAEFSRVVDKEIEVRPSPKIMRHAVSIDEKRIKFQPVLFKPPKLFGEKPKISRTSTWAAKAESAISHSPRLEDFEEVYFAGDHSDVGGGWPSEKPGPSQIPLMWMVQEAIWAELTFDPIQLKRHGCFNPRIEDYDPKILEAAERAQIHDSLGYDSGRGVETLFWRVMEYLPIKRPKVGPDGNVRETRWHGRGLRRPLPEEAKIHASVLHRLGYDREYRPFNLGMGNKTTVEEKREELQQLTRWKRVVHDKLCEYWVKMPDERARQ
ncbi:T6SS phospholipase effector Tle1-like catalytic domain-containing protein [Aspergillus alliaceus]|uniref:T6SS phospholipase effector Tle1-like catalytic domain-containing protein n=1 Tax=Petromyces alliaceus TaxID=209559 RepID=UPI0012A638EE|nr:uncharacterized protein BDW43DRAFT_321279 [Aspergillus alliaceus]KAB8238238.1 hypothetical protein BDW43DRAFT_321279 [Aspergillus alliaceus]